MSQRIRSSIVCVVVASVLLLTGCGVDASVEKEGSSAEVLNVPDSNPWKAEITEEFESTKVPFVRKVLSDGVVTDQEWAEMQSRYQKCLNDLGLKSIPRGTDGEEGIQVIDEKPHEDIDAETNGCSESSGQSVVGPIYSFMRRNPDNEDPVGILLQCLKDRGAVEKGVKLDQFKEKYGDWDYMKSLGEDHDKCAADPKGLLQ